MYKIVRLFMAALAMTCFAATVPGSLVRAQQSPAASTVDPGRTGGAIKQIALTEKQVEGVIAAQQDIDAITDNLPESTADKPDAKVEAQLDAVAKKYGFAGYAEYSNVVDNIDLVLTGIDPQTRTFLQPPDVLKKQIAAIAADTKMPAADKNAALDEMNAALKTTPTIQFQENVALVIKNYDRLSAALQDDQ